MTDEATNDPRWLALSPERRNKLLEQYRYREVDDGCEWWDFIEEQFEEQCLEVGIRVDNMYFSGFSSQGDGACFEGAVVDWAKYLPVLKHPEWVEFSDCWGARCSASGRYSHSGTMQLSSEFPLDRTNPYDENEAPLQFSAWEVKNPNVPTETQLLDLEDEILNDLKSRADQLYEDLEAEHDYLTDDDTVVERLLNDLSDEDLKGEVEEEAEETAEEI